MFENNKINLAKKAFYGMNTELFNYIAQKLGYTMDGIFYPANSCSLQDAINIVDKMTDEELKRFIQY
jgi:hypothetical protein